MKVVCVSETFSQTEGEFSYGLSHFKGICFTASCISSFNVCNAAHSYQWDTALMQYSDLVFLLFD